MVLQLKNCCNYKQSACVMGNLKNQYSILISDNDLIISNKFPARIHGALTGGHFSIRRALDIKETAQITLADTERDA